MKDSVFFSNKLIMPEVMSLSTTDQNHPQQRLNSEVRFDLKGTFRSFKSGRKKKKKTSSFQTCIVYFCSFIDHTLTDKATKLVF